MGCENILLSVVKAIIKTIGFLLSGGGLSWFANVCQLTNFNVISYFFDPANAPSSYIITLLGVLNVFQYNYYRERKENYNSSIVCAGDTHLLDEISSVFTSSKVNNLFHYLENNKIVLIKTKDEFERGVNQFSSVEKKFRNKKLENAKIEFFNALTSLFCFCKASDTDAAAIKFTEYKIYECQTHLTKLRASWSKLQELIKAIAPEYNWK